ncbi:MAG: hypothetical protein ACJ8DP_08770, partial [Microvirga sp.]
GLAASVALLAGAAAWAFRHRPGALRASGLALVVSLLASPIAWIHYTLFLLPVFFSRWSSPFARLAGALLIIPVPLVLAHLGRPAWIQATVGSLYGWAVLLVLADFLRGRAEAAPDNKGLDPWSGLA